ncbi:hypothetical protein HK097_002651 [Rhizophlyctis rosea]|uniref:BTB domain-containing protein n=1 Tax=Rhizophlyctis rosea TaxID=64517 RepID=A0AAD5S505_9FUNG|nr:hypothetical protein HK097_002651 [Rhizophlyctis rosea]
MSDSPLTLNVGGTLFTTSKDTLTAESEYFRALFSENFASPLHNGSIFIDRDPETFAHILQYLRTNRFPIFHNSNKGFDLELYANIRSDALFYGIDSLVEFIEKKRFEEQVEVIVTQHTFSHDFISQTLSSKLVIESVHRIEIEEEYWKCPRGIYAHWSSNRCGKECWKRMENGDEGGSMTRTVPKWVAVCTERVYKEVTQV